MKPWAVAALAGSLVAGQSINAYNPNEPGYIVYIGIGDEAFCVASSSTSSGLLPTSVTVSTGSTSTSTTTPIISPTTTATATGYLINVEATNTQPTYYKQRRQISSFYIAESGGSSATCQGAAAFEINDSGELQSLSDGSISFAPIGANSSDLFGEGTPGYGAVTTTFSIVGGALVWSNTAFTGGQALFCADGATVEASYNGVYPSGCSQVTLAVVPASDCTGYETTSSATGSTTSGVSVSTVTTSNTKTSPTSGTTSILPTSVTTTSGGTNTSTTVASPSASVYTGDLSADYEGCYLSTAAAPPLSGVNTTCTSLESCLAFCASYSLFSVTDGNQCICANAFSGAYKPPTIEDSSCDLPCSAGNGETCGGEDAAQVYSIISGTASTTTPTGSSTGLSTTPITTPTTSTHSSQPTVTSPTEPYCGQYNGDVIEVNGTYAQIACNNGISGAGDLPVTATALNLASCLQQCIAYNGNKTAADKTCVSVTYLRDSSQDNCYFHVDQSGTFYYDIATDSARLVGGTYDYVSASDTVETASPTASSATPSTTATGTGTDTTTTPTTTDTATTPTDTATTLTNTATTPTDTATTPTDTATTPTDTATTPTDTATTPTDPTTTTTTIDDTPVASYPPQNTAIIAEGLCPILPGQIFNEDGGPSYYGGQLLMDDGLNQYDIVCGDAGTYVHWSQPNINGTYREDRFDQCCQRCTDANTQAGTFVCYGAVWEDLQSDTTKLNNPAAINCNLFDFYSSTANDGDTYEYGWIMGVQSSQDVLLYLTEPIPLVTATYQNGYSAGNTSQLLALSDFPTFQIFGATDSGIWISSNGFIAIPNGDYYTDAELSGEYFDAEQLPLSTPGNRNPVENGDGTAGGIPKGIVFPFWTSSGPEGTVGSGGNGGGPGQYSFSQSGVYYQVDTSGADSILSLEYFVQEQNVDGGAVYRYVVTTSTASPGVWSVYYMSMDEDTINNPAFTIGADGTTATNGPIVIQNLDADQTTIFGLGGHYYTIDTNGGGSFTSGTFTPGAYRSWTGTPVGAAEDPPTNPTPTP